jgi:MoxR-like ATPase
MMYVVADELREAVRVAEITGRPLLLKGEPGTGKTLLAHHLAAEKKLPLLTWGIKSTTLAKDGLYSYDTLTRLNDARFGSPHGRDVQKPKDYIRLETMGEAFKLGNCILLIDEIDKADIEFPNDLLHELDRMEFTIPETGEVIKAQIRPLVIITSNNEKELPDAFLRRCVFHFIQFPEKSFMEKIVRAHHPQIEKSLLDMALESFYILREKDLKKKPSTSELIDWINVLLSQGAKPQANQVPFLTTLIKNEDDLRLAKGR